MYIINYIIYLYYQFKWLIFCSFIYIIVLLFQLEFIGKIISKRTNQIAINELSISSNMKYCPGFEIINII